MAWTQFRKRSTAGIGRTACPNPLARVSQVKDNSLVLTFNQKAQELFGSVRRYDVFVDGRRIGLRGNPAGDYIATKSSTLFRIACTSLLREMGCKHGDVFRVTTEASADGCMIVLTPMEVAQ